MPPCLIFNDIKKSSSIYGCLCMDTSLQLLRNNCYMTLFKDIISTTVLAFLVRRTYFLLKPTEKLIDSLQNSDIFANNLLTLSHPFLKYNFMIFFTNFSLNYAWPKMAFLTTKFVLKNIIYFFKTKH